MSTSVIGSLAKEEGGSTKKPPVVTIEVLPKAPKDLCCILKLPAFSLKVDLS